jgi:hypothetical protein
MTIQDDTETKTKPTIDELFASGRMYMLRPREAVVNYIYLDGLCVGTMWVELCEEAPCGFFETCFVPYHKWPERLEELVGGSSKMPDAEEALAYRIVERVRELMQED